MISASVPDWAWMELGVDESRACVIWRKAPQVAVAATDQLRGRVMVAGEFIAADTSVDNEVQQELADVIFDGASFPPANPMRWLSWTLHAFPGCAVTAAWRSSDVCAVATRQGIFAISACGADVEELGARFRLFACAAFVHGWLSARWPMVPLARGYIEIRPGSAAALPGMRENGDRRVPFSVLVGSRPLTRPVPQFPLAYF